MNLNLRLYWVLYWLGIMGAAGYTINGGLADPVGYILPLAMIAPYYYHTRIVDTDAPDAAATTK